MTSSQSHAVGGCDVKVSVLDYGETEVLDGQLLLSCACATFACKGEDRHIVCYGSHNLEDCQDQSDDRVPLLVGFAGVFDGHDGPCAAEYCQAGLVQHIIAETTDCIHRCGSSRTVTAIDGSLAISALEAGTINAFHRAESRFVAHLPPPTFEDAKKGAAATRFKKRLGTLFLSPPPPKRGGTTAVVMSIYGEKAEPFDEDYTPMPYVLVANTGDSRLITDDGSGTEIFRQITTDHRPIDPSECSRLTPYIRKGEARLSYEFDDEPTPRIFPGGLGVSRTIGDASMSKACVCTPDIFRVPLVNSGVQRTQRFILGCDGLFDVLPNRRVGACAARLQSAERTSTNKATSPESEENAHDANTVSPKEAAIRVMEECLRWGGCQDDVTVLVLDITSTSKTVWSTPNV